MKVALLDYDNTLSDGYAKYELGFRLEEEGLIKKGFRDEIMSLESEYESGTFDYNEKFMLDKKIFLRYFVGLSRAEVSRFVYNDFDMESLLYPWSKEFISILKENGYLTVLITGCWDFIIEKAQEMLDIDSFFASQFVIKEGNLTKEFAVLTDNNRKRVVTSQLLADAESSLGFGDSIADFEILSRVDIPFLLEGNKEAIDRAKDMNFTIVSHQNVLDVVREKIQ